MTLQIGGTVRLADTSDRTKLVAFDQMSLALVCVDLVRPDAVAT
jgi:hypothetical protein